MPAQAGIQDLPAGVSAYAPWIPAFAGMTCLGYPSELSELTTSSLLGLTDN